MKRWIVVILALVLLAGVGCAKQVDPGPVVLPPTVEELVEEPLGEIIGGEVPVRDPFKQGALTSDWEKESALANLGGRDPFTLAANVVVEPEPVEPEPQEPINPEPQEPTEIVLTGDVVVVLKTLDRCWLEVFVDSQQVLRTNVPVDRELTWAGKSEVRLQQVGRDYAVEVSVNGKSFGLLSELVKKMSSGVYIDRETGVRVSVENSYAGGVLVGLRFSPLN